jgi:uncharacterized protein (DUF736 family)
VRAARVGRIPLLDPILAPVDDLDDRLRAGRFKRRGHETHFGRLPPAAFHWAANRGDGAALPRASCRQPGARRFSPVGAFLAEQILRVASGPPLPLRSQAMPAARPSPTGDRRQGRMGRPDSTERRFIMTTIGTFTAQGQGYTGTVHTLTVNVKAKIVPAEKESGNAPDFRVFAGSHEIGAAWKKTSKANRPYLSVTFDDPSFPAPVYARLIEGEGGNHNLIWSRPNRD